MDKRLLVFIAAVVSMLSVGADNYLFTDFTSSMPKTYTIEDKDGIEIPADIYRNVSTGAAWVRARVGTHGYCAVSLTRGGNFAQDNWLITPAVSIEDDNAVLRWDARSLVRQLPESYRVMAKESDVADWKELLEVEAESEEWTTHTLPLAQYKGKEVQVAFVATTVNGYMLCVDNITLGVLRDAKIVLNLHAGHYATPQNPVAIEGTVTNAGAPATWSEIVLKADDSEQTAEIDATESEWSFSFSLQPADGEVQDYTLMLRDASGNTQILAEDWAICSPCKRMPLLDRASGIWCTNCPAAELEVDVLRKRFGSELAVAEAHCNDDLTTTYWNCFSNYVFNIPSLVVNHCSESVAEYGDDPRIASELQQGANVAITLRLADTANGTAGITAEVMSAVGLDNSTDRYRLAYLLLADIHNPNKHGYIQTNGMATFQDEKYYFFPTEVPAELMWYENVPVQTVSPADGVAESLPATIQPSETYQHTCRIQLPTDSHFTNLRALAYLLDTTTGEVLNSALLPLNGGGSTVERIESDNCCFSAASGAISANGSTDGVEVYTIQGIKMRNANLLPGIYIARKGDAITRLILK